MNIGLRGSLAAVSRAAAEPAARVCAAAGNNITLEPGTPHEPEKNHRGLRVPGTGLSSLVSAAAFYS